MIYRKYSLVFIFFKTYHIKGPTCRQPVDRHAGKSSDPDSTALDPVDLIHLLLYFLEIAYYFSYIT